MTLIAVVSDKGSCLLFGDLLLSTDADPSERTVHLPTQDISIAAAERIMSISSMVQKTCIVSDYLAVGWSGSRIIATTIIREMMENFDPSRPVSLDEMHKFLSQVTSVRHVSQ